MTRATLHIELLSYWHAGTGLRRGGDADATVQRDTDRLPYLPARTVKGLLREGVFLAASSAAGIPKDAAKIIFGSEDRTDLLRNFGAENGLIPDDEVRRWMLRSKEEIREALFDSLASTALTESGVARDRSLRVVEVSLPLALRAKIEWNEAALDPALAPFTTFAVLAMGARLIRSLGSHRHRGLGRCRAELILGR